MVDLHVHTMYSLLDGMIKPKELIEKIKEQGKTAICVTDHGHLYGNVEVYQLCKENNIKYLHGCEIYVCDNVEEKSKDNKYYHLVLIAINEKGRQNLNLIVSEANQYKYYGKPRIALKRLRVYTEGLLACSACMAGELDKALLNDDYEYAKDIVIRYKYAFGGRYFIELQSHVEQTQIYLNQKLIELAEETNTPYIITTDAHYLNQDEQKYHSVFIQINQDREVGETYNDCYIQTEEEVYEKCSYLPKEKIAKALANTDKIAEMCNVELPLSAPIMPVEKIPPQFESQMDYLWHLCQKGWIDRKINLKSEEDKKIYRNRLQYEMTAIEKMGFEGYYLFVWGYANSVKRRGIARGSGGGSLVAYLTKIVDIDPIRHGLYFERFIDVSALPLLEKGEITKKDLKVPDFDLDFGKTDRDKVMQFVINRYSQDRVACLGLFQYMKAKGAIKDVGRVLNIPFEVTNEMTKNLGDATIEQALDLGLLDKYENEYPELFVYAKKLAGLPKSFGAHPCGRVASPQSTVYYSAVDINDEGDYIIEGDMHTAEDLGLVKADFLGLRTVDVIYDTLEMIHEGYEYIAPHNTLFDDKQVWDAFAKGLTEGIFQFESAGMKGTLIDMECSSLEDLTVANALYRPGAMAFISNYNNRKKGKEEFEFLHPDLSDILGNSYGIIVYQEQLIEIGRLAGLHNPDEIRKATAKKKIKLMAKIEPELKNGLMSRDWSQEQVDTLWDTILDFAKYSFNKSHACAYAIIAYICMFLKIHHTREFMCAWINSYIGKNEHLSPCLTEAKRMGVKVYEPVWGRAYPTTQVFEDGIVLGIASIKFCNADMAQQLTYLYQNGKYNNFVELLKDIKENTTINSRQLNVLIGINFFKDFGQNKYLADITKLYDELGDIKQIKKEKIAELTENYGLTEDVIRACAGKETAKLFKDLDTSILLKDLVNAIPNKTFTVKEQIKFEMENLQYTDYRNERVSDKFWAVVFVKTYKDETKPYLTLHNIKTGEKKNTKIKQGNRFIENPFGLYSILKIDSFAQQYKTKQIGGKWQKTDELEDILENWAVVQK